MTEDTDLVSAEWLRRRGFTVDSRIPDCATTALSGIQIAKMEHVIVDGKLTIRTSYSFAEPFKWVTSEGTIEL